MRWFKHTADARSHPKLKRVEQTLGEAGYARAFKLLEVIAQRGGSGADFKPQLNLRDAAADLDWLAGELGISSRETRRTLNVFSRVGFIDAAQWKKRIVFVPAMLRLRDEWATRPAKTRKSLTSNSGAACETLGRNSVPELESESKSEYRQKT